MGKKLEANGLWEYSRFIIPQHAEQTRRLETESKRMERTTLDDQEMELISTALKQSQVYAKTIYLSVFTEYLIRNVTGIVTSSQRDCYRLDTEDPFTGESDWEWVMFQDVIKAELSHEWTDVEMIDP